MSFVVMLAAGCALGEPGAFEQPDGGDVKGDEPTDAGPTPDAAPPELSSPFDVVVDVPPVGPYGSITFDLPAGTNWVNTGLFLRQGEQATVSASGTWSYDGTGYSADGGGPATGHGDCSNGMLVGRVGLHYEEDRTCLGANSTFVASHDGIFYLAMNVSTDLGETYESRRLAEGTVEVTVVSSGDTVPTVRVTDLSTFDLDGISSGWVEVTGKHITVTLAAANAKADLATAVGAFETLDDIYEEHEALRGAVPHRGQRIRFFPDPVMDEKGWYMLAGNPVRCVPDLMAGNDQQRILRAAEANTDIWGFAHELGHDFTMIGGTWTYMILNLESWPNLFTLHALEALGRSDDQPNASTYCDGKSAYLANPSYDTLKSDPFLQLCFLQEFTDAHGWEFWQDFFGAMNTTVNADVPNVGSQPLAESLWGWLRDRFDDAAQDSTLAIFELWSVPLPL